MVEWLDPNTWHGGLKTLTGAVNLYKRLRGKPTPKGGAAPGIDAYARERVENLVDVVGKILDAMKEEAELELQAKRSLLNAMKVTAGGETEVNKRLLDLITTVNDRVTILDNKITALEGAAKKQTAPKKKPRKRKS